MIKEADENWLPFYYVNPGSSCYNSERKKTIKVEKDVQITTFVDDYLQNKLVPILDNEDIEASFNSSKFENDFFNKEGQTIKKINAQMLDTIARDSTLYNFMVLSCSFDSHYCREGI